MPTYQYLCRDCEHRFDIVQSIHDDALTICPECGGTIRRVLHPVGVTFKGSGFYRTDSREKKKSSTTTAPAAGSGEGKGTAATTKADAATASDSSSSTSSSETKAAPAAKPSGSGSTSKG
ncbi:MAG: hypothetical protein QG597_1676 [Actinomycetota bacterium]|nr:hypothetical protein [Actinomycetota bacterium]